MATIRSFEDIVAWQKARVLSKKIFEITRKGEFAKDFDLRNQINASSGSIMDNIAEGFGRGGTREFITFMSYSRGSAEETRSQLYRAFDRNYIDEKTLESLKEEAIEVGKMITGFMTYLQNTDIKGSKFHEPTEVYHTNPNRPVDETASN